jgi:hypothetical protein
LLSNIQMRKSILANTSKSILANTKRRGCPIATGRGHLIGVRLLPALLTALEAFIAGSPGERSRPEAIRAILAERFDREGARQGFVRSRR